MNTLKRATVLLAALLGFAATQALADDAAPAATSQAVKLSDAELDNVTAGSAIVSTAIFNAGNAEVLKFNEDPTFPHAHCVNCGGSNPFDGKARFITVVNPARTVMKCVASIGGVSICP